MTDKFMSDCESLMEKNRNEEAAKTNCKNTFPLIAQIESTQIGKLEAGFVQPVIDQVLKFQVPLTVIKPEIVTLK